MAARSSATRVRTALLGACLAAAAIVVYLALVLPAAPLAQGSAAAPALGSTANGSLQPARSPRNANYRIDAYLDAENRAITGIEVITWRNITNRPTSELQFHLYWNAWRNTRSTFFREAVLAGAAVRAEPEDFATMDITSIKLVDRGSTLTDRQQFIAPDDGNPEDQTVLRVPLPAPVLPGESLTIEVRWNARVPAPFARTGVVGDFYFIAQWFPKLGVLTDSGWNCHQFHYTTEFFSDFGVYDVRLTIPAGWVLGATGVERERGAHEDNAMHRYYQEDVHDFAWTASPDYVEHRARFEHPDLPPVDMRLLLQPEHDGQEERHFAATRTALKYYGEWFGPYPYGHITIVDPAFQSDAGGMEYPTLITAGTSWLTPRRVTINTPEEVTIHEAGHQFFYGIVATDETEHAWMDEGLTTYATARAFVQDYRESFHEARFFGGVVPWVFRDLPLKRETFWNRLAGYRTATESDTPSQPSYLFHPRSGRYITYNKTALWLNTLERMIGWPAMQKGMATYFSRGAFSHPVPQDFFDAMTEAAGRDLSPFFDEVYRSSNTFDYGVETLYATENQGRQRTTVTVRRYGEGIFPVDVRVTFADGQQVTERWDGRDRWRLFTFDRDAAAVSAEIDPDRVLLLDINLTNNSRTLRPQTSAAATKWSLKWMVWLQDAMLTWGFFL
jgi:hypothetical protein